MWADPSMSTWSIWRIVCYQDEYRDHSNWFHYRGFSVGRTEILFVKNQKKRGYVANHKHLEYLKLEEPTSFSYFVLTFTRVLTRREHFTESSSAAAAVNVQVPSTASSTIGTTRFGCIWTIGCHVDWWRARECVAVWRVQRTTWPQWAR